MGKKYSILEGIIGYLILKGKNLTIIQIKLKLEIL